MKNHLITSSNKNNSTANSLPDDIKTAGGQLRQNKGY
jgi:hypothetical protein